MDIYKTISILIVIFAIFFGIGFNASRIDTLHDQVTAIVDILLKYEGKR